VAGRLEGRPGMARRSLNRGEIWTYRFARPDKRRPVLILTRQALLGLVHTASIAPITSTIRGVQSEVVVGVDEGLAHTSAINLDRIQTVEQARLMSFVGHVGPREDARSMSRPDDRFGV
jgi:mRNA interferase MazF